MNLRHRQKWWRSKASLGLCMLPLDLYSVQRWLIKVRPDPAVPKGSKLSGHRVNLGRMSSSNTCSKLSDQSKQRWKE